MANNYIISYDLISPGQPYRHVQDAIESCGAWGKLEFSLYYVNSSLSINQVSNTIRAVMDENDSLVVVNVSKGEFKCFNVDQDALKQMQDHWNR